MTKHDTSSIVYYNALTVNSGSGVIAAEYRSVENYGIVQIPNQYHMSVIRFFLSARNILPIFWWNQTQNLALPQQYGVYMVSLSFNGTVTQSRLVFRTQDLGGTPPPSPTRTITANNALYWTVYNHSFFIEAINGALEDAYYQMSVLEPLSPPVQANAEAPFLEFDRVSGLISLVAHRSFSSLFVGGETIKIWMNDQLYTFMSESMRYQDAFPLNNNPLGADLAFSLWVGDRGDNTTQIAKNTAAPQWLTNANYVTDQLTEYDGVNYVALGPSIGSIPPLNPVDWAPQLNTVPDEWDPVGAYAIGDRVSYNGSYYIGIVAVPLGIPGSNNDWALDPSFICYRMTQDYPSTYRWIAIQRYILQGTGFSAMQEILPPVGGGFSKSAEPFLIDFTPDFSDSADAAGASSGNILYTPTAEYKRIELSGQDPITTVFLSVSVMTNNGLILPVFLGPGGSFSCKLVFERIGDR